MATPTVENYLKELYIEQQLTPGQLIPMGRLAMAMNVAHFQGAAETSASLGAAGIDELRWLRPVYPGDVLRCETIVEAVRPSTSRPDMGSVRSRMTVFNQDDVAVMRFVAIGLYRRRPGAHHAPRRDARPADAALQPRDRQQHQEGTARRHATPRRPG